MPVHLEMLRVLKVRVPAPNTVSKLKYSLYSSIAANSFCYSDLQHDPVTLLPEHYVFIKTQGGLYQQLGIHCERHICLCSCQCPIALPSMLRSQICCMLMRSPIHRLIRYRAFCGSGTCDISATWLGPQS